MTAKSLLSLARRSPSLRRAGDGPTAMGVLVSKLLGVIMGNKEVRVLILGLDNAGKTTILYKLQMGEVVTTVPTIGFNVETVQCAAHFLRRAISARLAASPLPRPPSPPPPSPPSPLTAALAPAQI